MDVDRPPLARAQEGDRGGPASLRALSARALSSRDGRLRFTDPAHTASRRMPRRKEWGASVFVVNSAYAEEREDMATIVTPMNERRSIGRAGARLGFWLGIAALVLLAAGPLGWRTGLMHYRVGLIYLMPAAALAAAAAVMVSLVSFGWWRSLARRRRVLAAIGLVLGAAVLSAPLQAYLRRGTAPSIHDITTDTANP